eukprot:COSAG06_NODE_1623_length_8895_cov_86.951683_2_plen_87_part_00
MSFVAAPTPSAGPPPLNTLGLPPLDAAAPAPPSAPAAAAAASAALELSSREPNALRWSAAERKRSVFEFSLCLSRACLGKNEQSSI